MYIGDDVGIGHGGRIRLPSFESALKRKCPGIELHSWSMNNGLIISYLSISPSPIQCKSKCKQDSLLRSLLQCPFDKGSSVPNKQISDLFSTRGMWWINYWKKNDSLFLKGWKVLKGSVSLRNYDNDKLAHLIISVLGTLLILKFVRCCIHWPSRFPANRSSAWCFLILPCIVW